MSAAPPYKRRCGGENCGQDIAWTTNGETGRAVPVDWEPAEDGNVAVRKSADGRELISRYLKKGEEPIRGEKRAMPHHATCPDRDKYRRGGSRKPPAGGWARCNHDGRPISPGDQAALDTALAELRAAGTAWTTVTEERKS